MQKLKVADLVHFFTHMHPLHPPMSELRPPSIWVAWGGGGVVLQPYLIMPGANGNGLPKPSPLVLGYIRKWLPVRLFRGWPTKNPPTVSIKKK